METVERAQEDRGDALRRELRRWLDEPVVREALYLSSPSLHAGLVAWSNGALDENRSQAKVDRTLLRYFARMCGRPMPFGLQATTSLVVDGEGIPFSDAVRRVSRLDFGCLFPLVRRLAEQPGVAGLLHYFPNQTLTRVGAAFHYIAQSGEGHTLTSVDASDELIHLILVSEGGTTLSALSEALVARAGCERPDATAFVGELVEAQVLCLEIEPTLTSDDGLGVLRAQLSALDSPEARAFETGLGDISAHLSAADSEPNGLHVHRYEAIRTEVSRLWPGLEEKSLVQVDAFREPSQVPGFGQARLLIEENFDAAWTFCAALPSPLLKEFVDRFRARFEDSEQPFMVVLNPDSGIGFGPRPQQLSDLIRKLPMGGGATKQLTPNHRDSLLSTRLSELVSQGADEWEVTSEDVARAKELLGTVPSVPTSMVATCKLFRTVTDPSQYAVVMGEATGPSAARMLGRFLHGNEALLRWVRDELALEEARQPEAIFAELLHLSDDRAGNVLSRPKLREFELPCGGQSRVARGKQVRLEDLRISLDGDDIVLRSEHHDRRVFPRLSNAHNYERSVLPHYRFLAEFQRSTAHSPGMPWIWGRLPLQQYYPAVRAGRLYLSARHWHIFPHQLQEIAASKRPTLEFGRLRDRLRLPRHVAQIEDDLQLPLDLDSGPCLELLLHGAKSEPRTLWLTEIAPLGYVSPIKTNMGTYANELMIPLRAAPSRSEPRTELIRSVPSAASSELQRTFLPSSSWLYVKLYCGESLIDDLLILGVRPLIDAYGAAVEDWFFVRYEDAGTHLRLRFRGEQSFLYLDLLPRLAALVDKNSGIHKIEIDTYQREVERYAGFGDVAWAERVFTADSHCALALIGLCADDPSARWKTGLLSMRTLLEDFGLTDPEKASVLLELRDRYRAEYGISDPGVLGQRYRQLKEEATRFVRAKGQLADKIHRVIELRSRSIRALVTEARRRPNTRSAGSVVGSYLHMHVNRLLPSQQRANEMVLCDFLARMIKSEISQRRVLALDKGAG